MSALGVASSRWATWLFAALLSACAAAPSPPLAPPSVPVAAAAVEAPLPPPPTFGNLEKTSTGGVMFPPDLPDAFDVVVHFHFGKPIEPEYRASGIRAAVVFADHGTYAKAYNEAYEDPQRFSGVIDEAMHVVRERLGRPDMHPARIALVAWSAGYGAVRKVLQQGVVPVDTVVLLDGLHASYRGPWRARKPDPKDIAVFVDFARAAAHGDKLMVVTHSAIVPGDYASTTETADMLVDALATERVTLSGDEADGESGLRPTSRVDVGDFHLRAFAGDTKEVHVAQLHLVDLALREYLVPRWSDPRVSAAHASRALP